MIICQECGEENPQGSKFCRKCGVNLVHKNETTENKETIKATVINNNQNQQETVRTTTASTTKKDNDNLWCLGCCICMFFLFIIFAIASV